MGLKPIGSEKLKGQDKIRRIMELARYGESKNKVKNRVNHMSTVSFIKEARDGNFYAIVNEKDGYYLKTGINENTLDYINGINNKKKNRFKSYSAALKKLNLALKPINEIYGDGDGDSLYEQSSGENKFVLKTPEVEVEDEEIVTDDDMGGEEDFELDDEMGDDELEDDELAVDDEMALDAEEEMEGAMKSIQKLTGKLGQKLRANEEEIESEDIKYVINSVLSAVDLDKLDDEDKEDIVDRFDEDESEYGDEEIAADDLEMGDEEVDDMEDMEDEGEGAEFDMEAMVPESTKRRKGIQEQKKPPLGGYQPMSAEMIISMLELIQQRKTESEKRKEKIKELLKFLLLIKPWPVAKARPLLKMLKKQYSDIWKLVDQTYKEEAGGKTGKEERMETLKDRVSTLLESYYIKEDPKQYIKDKVKKNKIVKFIEENSTSIEQELATKQYIKENKYSKLKGLTESGLLVIESDDEQIRINKVGKIV